MIALGVILILGIVLFLGTKLLNIKLLFSNSTMFIILGIYILAGIASIIFISTMNQSSAVTLTAEEQSKKNAENEQLFHLLMNGNFEEIDQKHVLQKQTFTLSSKQLYVKHREGNDITIYLKYIDAPNSNNITVKSYRDLFLVNKMDLTEQKPSVNMSLTRYDELILNVESNSINLAKVSGSLPLEEISEIGAHGFNTIGGNQVISLEVPSHISILNEEDLMSITN